MTIEQIIRHNIAVSSKKEAERIAEELNVPSYWRNRISMQFQPASYPHGGMHVECKISSGRDSSITLSKDDVCWIFQFIQQHWPEALGDLPHIDQDGEPALNTMIVASMLKRTGLFDAMSKFPDIETWNEDQLREAWTWAVMQESVFGENGIPGHVRELASTAGKEQ